MVDYYTIENRISNSFLSELKREIEGKTSSKNEEAMRFGSGLHAMLLEPHKFNNYDFTGKDRLKMMQMVASIKSNADASHLVGEKEKEFMYDFLNFPCKLKADIVGNNFVVDIKTTMVTSMESFMEQAITYDYHRQAAWYLDCPLIKADKFIFIAVSKASPYEVFTWELGYNHPIIEAGREEYLTLLDHIRKREKLMQRFKAETVFN